MENLIFSKAELCDLDIIMQLYKKVIQTTFTTWDENYPSKELIKSDIQNKNLYVLKKDNKIIAVSFLGKKEEENENWHLPYKKAYGVARICVSPDFQGQGIATIFMKYLIQEAKNNNVDTMHFHVCTKNISAIKMYQKVGFKNYGLGKSNYGFDYYKFEQKI